MALRRTAAATGRAYRIGGDEFCALIDGDDAASVEVAHALADALADSGEGFTVTAAHGWAALSADARTAGDALRLADIRMYADKHRGRVSAVEQAARCLQQALTERSPSLGEHVHDVAELAAAVASQLDLPATQIADIRRAAEFHDVGKMGVPDAILDKPGPLDPEEWAFVRRHTLIGERILQAAPDTARVAPLVRSSHERWDGAGYPDGLAGSAIPLGARTVAVCDAFDAMVADRPYRRRRPHDAATAELRRCAGTQFDPAVVEAGLRVLGTRSSSAARTAA